MSEPSDHGGDAGFDEFLDAVASDDGYYLRCASGHGAVPPTQRCPVCGDEALTPHPLSEAGELEDATTVHVAPTGFEDETPYVVGIAQFGPVTLTGRVRGLDANAGTTGTAVVPTVEDSPTTGKRLLVFRPRE
ncbi:Zn-ribbon domain-containing OB-fold protein [Haloarchaeobius sp. TZWWS8]|uniref:Zn-ribbon domain-containing OB-fold protein n=1 Tax=Haloarchaeobius sp. TZWWS8 TaxID=3446121 RepID=UPI003EBB4BD2